MIHRLVYRSSMLHGLTRSSHCEKLPKSREIAEVEVESVAYIVCDAVGFDASGYCSRLGRPMIGGIQ